jgi:hypothetical protein
MISWFVSLILVPSLYAGFADMNPVLGKNPAAEDFLRIWNSPWAQMLSHEEAQQVMRMLGDSVIGLPHPNSAGNDMYFQVIASEGKNKTVSCLSFAL